MSESLYDFCRKYDRQYLLEEWDSEKNLPLMPDGVTHGSHTMAWWRCGCGHSWQAPVYTRAAGSGCPYCAGKKLGQSNDFASLYPDLAVQWDTRKNAPRKPSEFPAGSHHLAWWVCEKGHSWRAQINSRVSGGCGCPVCAGRLVQTGENDLASQFPRLVKEWDIEKNGALTPEKVTAKTSRKVWWRCSLGHRWQAAVASRTVSGSRLPGLCREADSAGVQRFGFSIPRTGKGVGYGEKRFPDPGFRLRLQQPEGMVALRKEPQLSGGHRHPHNARQRLPLLCQQESSARLQ